jgi:hypothetical protein
MGMEAIVLAGLLERGLKPHIAQGIVANMIAESRLDPGINEIAPLVPGSRGGFGVNQWTGPRRKALEAFAAERGKPVNDLGIQLDYTMHEFQGPERRAFEALQNAPDAVTAARVYSDKFLRPGIPNMGKRIREAARLSGSPIPTLGDTQSGMTGPMAALPLSMGEVVPEEGLPGLFGGSPLAPVASPRPPRREQEAAATTKRRQAFFGAGGLADTFG